MKLLPVLSASAVLGLAACNTLNSPISSSNFNPLSPPGGGVKTGENTAGFKPGDQVKAAMDGTAFFKKLPKGNADADKTLTRDTKMKVIRVADSYLQVELDQSGEVGYVPSVMVSDPRGSSAGRPGSPNEYQVYPPLPDSGSPLPPPPADPTGLPPEGTIPTVIDPDAGVSPSSKVGADQVPLIEPDVEGSKKPAKPGKSNVP